MNFFQRRKILKSANYLDLHPFPLCEYEKNENNLLTVFMPRFNNNLTRKIFNNKTEHIKLKLDEFGSTCWLLMDGENSVKEIADKLYSKFGEKIQPINERLTKFLTHLYMQKIIYFKELK
jgi:hypothetical protein